MPDEVNCAELTFQLIVLVIFVQVGLLTVVAVCVGAYVVCKTKKNRDQRRQQQTQQTQAKIVASKKTRNHHGQRSG